MRFLFLLFVISSCSHDNHKNTLIESETNTCVEIFEKASKKRGVEVASTLKQGAGYFTSYTLAGIGYTGDVILFTAGGIVTPVAVCSPLYPLVTAGSSNGGKAIELIFRCWIYVGAKVYGNINKALGGLMGANIYKATEDFRCPDLDWIEKALKKVAKCHKKNDDMRSYRLQMKAIKENNLKNQYCKPRSINDFVNS